MKKMEVRMPSKKIGHPLSSKQSSGQTKHNRTTGIKVTETQKGFPKCHD